MARSSTAVFMDLLLACYLANTACAITNIMTALIFIILIVSRLHAFFLVVPVRSSLHVLMVVAVISYFQQWQSMAREENQLKWPSRKIYVTDEPSLACPTILTETHTFDLSERYLMLDACSSQLELFIMFGFSWFRRCLKVKCGLGASLPHLKQSNCLALIII